jgi:integrase
MRRGELFALRKSDVDLTLGTILVARSNTRETTKGGHADLIPIAAPLFPIVKHQLKHAPGSLVFPAADGSQRSPEADPQKILRTALARAGLVEGYEHVCRWCGHKERHADNEQRYCPKCLKRTNGTGKPLAQPRGRALWPKAIPRPMRFHDLRHTTATLLLRAGVDAHRVQRLLRHCDVRTTTTIYGHLDVEDLRAAVAKLPELGPNWVAAQNDPESPASASANAPDSQDLTWWALGDSNPRPLPCEGGRSGFAPHSTQYHPALFASLNKVVSALIRHPLRLPHVTLSIP